MSNLSPSTATSAGNTDANANTTSNNTNNHNITAPETLVIPHVPTDFESRQRWIFNVRTQAIQPYAQQSKKLGGKMPPSSVQTDEWLRRIRGLLNYLEYGDFQITGEYRKGTTMMDIFLKFMFEDDRFQFPEDVKRRAKALYEEYERVNWGNGDVSDSKGSDNDDESEFSPGGGGGGGGGGGIGGRSSSNSDTAIIVTTNGTEPASTADGEFVVRFPPPNHPIWGVNGIMFGIAVKFGGKCPVMQLDRRYLRQKRDANVFGHNGLRPGAWFPSQLVALFRGAHGSRMGGIHGNRTQGAYSVVISGTYHKVDEDVGDKIYYSGPGSQENTDPHNLPKGSTDILQVSYESKRPIRVLRSSRNPFGLSPSIGIRYDGLYVVTRRMPLQKNDKGGLFAQFVLQRIGSGDLRDNRHQTEGENHDDDDEQESLLSIFRRSPTRAEKRDFERIKQWF
ncbi:PUA-like domain-containing protein [Coniella lustricola]|uniref:PUA-like domain-containing protein n=1 Tax=Coniella lustricola TaxID=2025994 RepID=A0A2T3AMQ0_9PEZI|nr:PUA-like domain-containing protein [Coniella lustricola]